MNNKILLDTPVLLDALLTPNKLKAEICDKITQAQAISELYIASISLWQIAEMVRQKQLYVYTRLADFLNEISQVKGLNIIELNASIAAESTTLPFEPSINSAEAIIISSTREIAATLITHNQAIIGFAQQGYLKVIENYGR